MSKQKFEDCLKKVQNLQNLINGYAGPNEYKPKGIRIRKDISALTKALSECRICVGSEFKEFKIANKAARAAAKSKGKSKSPAEKKR